MKKENKMIAVDGKRFKEAVVSVANGENMTLAGYLAHIGIVAQTVHGAAVRNRVNKDQYYYICKKAGLDAEEFLPSAKPKEEPKKNEETFASEDVKLLYRALSDMNRTLFDISMQLKELNGKAEAVRANGVNETVHLYDLKQQFIALNNELMGK